MRIFSLSYGQIAGNLNYFVMFPMTVYMRIGPFLLFSVPIYPQNFLADAQSLNIDIFPTPINISETNIFKILFESEENRNLKTKELPVCYLLYNFNTFVPESRKIHYLCLISSAGKEMPVYESKYSNSIPKTVLVDLMYGDKQKLENINFKHYETKIFGWDCFVYYEENPLVQRKNIRASLFGKEIIGEAVVSFHLNKKNYKRFPVYNLQGSSLIQILRKNIKECLGTLETSEDINNTNSLKELLHRKGLNYRHEWIIYSKCRSERAQILLECDLLARAVWKLACYKLPAGVNFLAYRNTIHKFLLPLLSHESKNYDPLIYLSLFTERLKCLRDASKFHKKSEESASRIIEPFKQKKHSYEYLQSSEILNKIITAGCLHPAQLLESVEYHCKIKFSEDLISACRCDGYYFMNPLKALTESDIIGLNLAVYSMSSLREENCITLLGFLERGGPKGNTSTDMLNESYAD